MKLARVKCSLAIEGLGWIAINEFYDLRSLPYCVGVEDYKEQKSAFRSYASGKLIFEVPEYYVETFKKIYDGANMVGLVSLYEQLPKRIPTIEEMRLDRLMEDKNCLTELKKGWLEASKYVRYTDKSEIYTKYGAFSYPLLYERIFKHIGIFERLLLKFT